MASRVVLVAAVLIAVLAGVRPASVNALSKHTQSKESATFVDKHARSDFIKRAHVWAPTDVASKNLRDGPRGGGAFRPGELVVCDYVERPMSGSSRKFYCAIRADEVVKVRYGDENGEVEGSVLATRLLWALGFPADRVYPVRVRCRGCPADPWKNRKPVDEVHDFNPAVIEKPPAGHEMRVGKTKAGWAWLELDHVDERVGGAPIEQRDALKLLASFMQHSDTKPQQQRLLCAPGALTDDGDCGLPFLSLHDVGVTFGRANTFNRDGTGSVNFEKWAGTPVWRNRDHCVAHLSRSNTGTLEDPEISEAGRRFLANLLQKLSDRQIRDLFDVARVELRSGRVADWVAVFKAKRDDIVTNRCPK